MGALDDPSHAPERELPARCADGRSDVHPKEARPRIQVQLYRCGFAASKGAAVCAHTAAYRADYLEGALLAKFRDGTTPPMIDELRRLLNRHIGAALQQYAARTKAVKIEISKLEREAGNLVQFLAEGNESAAVRETAGDDRVRARRPAARAGGDGTGDRADPC